MSTGNPVALRIAAGALWAAVTVATVGPAVAAAEEDPDCTDELQQIPRDGSTIGVDDPWLTYSGNIAYTDVADAGPSDFDIRGADVEVEASAFDEFDADSVIGAKVEGLSDGEYQWSAGEGPEASFTVESADVDESLPRIGDGEVEASMELVVYEEFPVMFRQWELSFPSGSDEVTEVENLRYLVEFTPEGADEPSDRILVTPTPENTPSLKVGTRKPVSVELGGRSDRCRHGEPAVSVTGHAEIRVRTVDLAGNLSEEAAVGAFEGVSEEALARAHDDLNEVIDSLEEESDDEEAQTTEEIARELEEEDDDADGDGCSMVGGGSTGGLLLVVLGLGLLRRGL